jgi:hypothetical protein
MNPLPRSFAHIQKLQRVFIFQALKKVVRIFQEQIAQDPYDPMKMDECASDSIGSQAI